MDTPTYKKIPFIYVGPGEVMSAGIVLPLVCATVVGLRFYTRKSQKVALGLDDWLTIPSLIMIFALGICFIVGVAKDVYGYRTVLPSDITPENQTTKVIPSYTIEAKIEFWFQLFLILAYGFIKLSILCFIRRIFNVTKGTIFNVISTAMLAMTVMWTIGFFLLFLFGCKSKVWAHWAPLAQFTEYCGNGLAAEMALIISDFITDVMIFLLPLPMIWSLHTTTSRKLEVSAVFCVGAVAIACSIVRMVLYIDISYLGYSGGYDLNQTVTTMLWYSMLEASLGLITACMPSLRTLFRKGFLSSMVTSLRSLVSQRSSTSPSGTDWSAPRPDPYSTIEGNVSSGSGAPIHGVNGDSAKSLGDTDSATSPTTLGHIHVKNGFHQDVSRV